MRMNTIQIPMKHLSPQVDARKQGHAKLNDGASIRFRTIIVPIDFSSQSLKALEFAQEIGRPFKARIVIIHVMDPLHAPGRLDSRKLRQLRVEALEEANAKLAEICRNHRKVEHHVINGMVHSEIVAFSNRMQADLIVMGSSGRTGANRFINGSIAEKVVRYAKRPVVVVR